MDSDMVEVNLLLLMDLNTLESFWKERFTVKVIYFIMEELTDGLMDALMKGRGLKAGCMEEDI